MSDKQGPRAGHAKATAARHGRQRRRSAWRLLLGVIGSVLAVTLVAGSSVAAIALWQLQSDITTVSIGADEGDAPATIAAYEGGFNILIVGSDTGEGQGGLGVGREGELNDVNMLLHVAEDQRSATLVSFPRDLIVPIPACENGGPASARPLNETLYMGGVPCTVATVEQLTGLEIQFAGLITFKGVIAMSNAVGGVDVCTDGPIIDPFSGINIASAGTHTLKGSEALAFLRSRKGVGDGSDLSRISSQQVFLSSLVRKIKSDDTFTDLGRLYGLAQAATKNMTLSENFARIDTLVQVALALKDVPLENITMVQYPGTTGAGGIYFNKVAPIQSQADALFAAIRSDVPLRLDEDALDTGRDAVTTDPNAPPPETEPNPAPTGSPSAEPSPSTDPTPGSEPVVVEGVKGQSAAQHTCSVGF